MMKTAKALLTLVIVCWPIAVLSAVPSDGERREIEMLVGAYYRAVAAEDLETLVNLHHWGNSFERDKVVDLVEQAFAVADSQFERILVRSIDLYPERGIGLVRVSIDYTVRSYDGADSFSGSQEMALVVVDKGRGWRVGRVSRAADFDLSFAASRLAELSDELEQEGAAVPQGAAEPPSAASKLPKLAGVSAPAAGAQPQRTGSSTAAPATAGQAGGLTFFALRRKATGQCEVAAGAEGISPGDTVLGAFADFAAAQAAVQASCHGEQSASPPVQNAGPAPSALTTERLYAPDEEVVRGRWGTVMRIAEDPVFSAAREGGAALPDGLFAVAGDDGPTEIVYRHDGSAVTVHGTAAVIDCIDYCGRMGSVQFFVRGDGSELWNSGILRQGDAGRPFAVDLDGVSELRLVVTDGGNGNDEDWSAWLDLRIGDEPQGVSTPAAIVASNAGPGGSGILAIPRYRGDESTAGTWVIDLEDGSAAFVDRVGIDGNTSRRRPVNLNVFTVLGRPSDKPATQGEILAGEIRSPGGAVIGIFLVETSTGAAAYLAGLDKEPHRATYRPVNGRPAAAIASDDGNFALVMRRDGAGGTDGAYLYHATTGQCVYFVHVDEMRADPVVKFTSPLPELPGRVVALPLQDGSEATPECLIIDDSSGAIFKVRGLEREPLRLTATRQQLGLFEFFPESPPTTASPRFVVVPGYSGNGAADAVFVIDAGSGRMAVLKNVRAAGGTQLVRSTKSLEGYLPAAEGETRALAAVPKVGDSGTTDGAWVFDAAMDGVVVLDHVRGPHSLKIRKIDGTSR